LTGIGKERRKAKLHYFKFGKEYKWWNKGRPVKKVMINRLT
jgi:hypothetical protein